MVKVDGEAQKGGVMDEAEASLPLWHFAPEKQLFINLHTKVIVKEHFGVPQAVDHDGNVVVELMD